MVNFHDTIHARTGKLFQSPVRPQHLDRIDAIHGSQSEVGPRVVSALVALAGLNDALPAAFAGVHANFRAEGIAMKGSSHS